MSVWDTVKSAGKVVFPVASYGTDLAVKGYDAVKGQVSGTPGGNQTELAQQSTAPAQADAAAIYAQAMSNAQAASEIPNASSIATPGVSAAQVDPGAFYANTNTTAQAVNALPSIQAYQAAQAQASDAAVQNVKEAQLTQAKYAGPADVSAVNTAVAAPTIGEAAQTRGVNVAGTTLDKSANALRSQEIAAANNIANGPSAAMAQFKAGEGQVLQDQLAMAAQARGAERAGARREAILQAGQQGAQQNLAASALAAQEQQQKNVAASNALSGIRSSDVATATTQANLDSQRSQLQAQLNAAIAQGNTSAINTIKQQQAQLDLQAQQSSVQAGLAQQGTLAGLSTANMQATQATNLANANAANTISATNANAYNQAMQQLAANQTAVSQSNAAATTGANAANAGAVNTAANNYAATASNVNLQNAQLAQQQAQANAARAATLAQGNQQATNAAATTNAGNALTAQATNANNQLAASQLRANAGNAALGTAVGATGQQNVAAQTIVDANKAQSGQAAQQQAALIGAAGAVGAAAASDERAKVDVRPLGAAQEYGRHVASALGAPQEASPYEMALSDERTKREVDAMGSGELVRQAKKFPLVTFRYRDGVEDGGAYPHVGTTAQGLERSGPLGKMFVREDPSGLKRVDYPALAYATAKAALASREGR